MSRRPIASVRARTLPHLHPDAIRIEVECSGPATNLTSIPGPGLALTRAQLVTNAVFAHEERCGECGTDQAHEQGDQMLRVEVDAASPLMRAEAARRYAGSRRN